VASSCWAAPSSLPLLFPLPACAAESEKEQEEEEEEEKKPPQAQVGREFITTQVT
jgi:hypothetical protein